MQKKIKMNINLQEELRELKIEYLKKLEKMIPDFWIIYKETNPTNIDNLYLKVHSISGTSGMYGLSELSEVSTQFEIYLQELKSDINLINEIELKERLFKYIKEIKNIAAKGE